MAKKSLSPKKLRHLAVKKFEREKLLNKLAKPGPMDLVIILEGLKPDFNIGKIFRSAQAFGIREIHLIGVENFDPYPAKGAFKKVPAKFFNTIEESIDYLLAKDYKVFHFDLAATDCLHQAKLPLKSAFLFGHEEFGPSPKAKSLIENSLIIKQIGDVESLNVSIAATLAMYEYVGQHT